VFVEAALAAGWPRNEDFNGASQQGFGFYQVTQRAGRRCSTAVAYLRPALQRPNLQVLRKATVLRVLLERGRAAGVEYVSQGRRATVRAAREVLLSAGAIGSPQLLLLSGIGPPEDLQAASVPVLVALPGVGRNLQDHLDFCTLYKCTRNITYDFGMWREAAVGLRYLLTGSGPGVSNVAEAGGFARTRFASDARADLQFHFVPAQLDDHGRNRLPGHGFTVHACVLRPASRGQVTLRSASAFDPPRIFAGYLSAGEDLAHLIEGVRISREIIAAGPFAPYRGREIFPGPDAVSEEQLRQVVRQKAESIYHPVGTCRMGVDDQAVVDADLRVRGVAGLRVVDASIMPRIIGGNTNAPTIMIAEKAADLIRQSGG
jgi:choline dehydrogenase